MHHRQDADVSCTLYKRSRSVSTRAVSKRRGLQSFIAGLLSPTQLASRRAFVRSDSLVIQSLKSNIIHRQNCRCSTWGTRAGKCRKGASVAEKHCIGRAFGVLSCSPTHLPIILGSCKKHPGTYFADWLVLSLCVRLVRGKEGWRDEATVLHRPTNGQRDIYI